MLTKQQAALLQVIHKHLKKFGISPSFDQMKDALRLKSKSGIHRMILCLEERGFIRRLPNRARSIEILRLPEIEADLPQDLLAEIDVLCAAKSRAKVIEGLLRQGLRNYEARAR